MFEPDTLLGGGEAAGGRSLQDERPKHTNQTSRVVPLLLVATGGSILVDCIIVS